MHKPFLQLGFPSAATGDSAQWLPSDDIVWKHVWVKGLTFIHAFLYLQRNIGLAGANVAKLRQLAVSSGRGKTVLFIF